MNRMNIKKNLGIFAVGFLLMHTANANQAIDILNNMNQAVHKLNYYGKLIYIKGSKPSTFRVEHYVKDGKEQEKIVNLTTGEKSVSEGKKSFLIKNAPKITQTMEEVYSFDLGESNNIAGQNCRVIIARPKDKMRYLQRYCINPKNGMLLHYALINRDRQTVERFMFTDLTMGINDQIVKTGHISKLSNTLRPTLVSSPGNLTKTESSKNNHWVFSQLPKGFQQQKMIKSIPSDKKQSIDQLILSDGITTVSIFITQKKNRSNHRNKLHKYGSGAINIYNKIINDYMITLMGEVPKSTLQAIANSLRYKP